MYKKILNELKNGNFVVLMSLYKSSGSTPRKAGAKMAYFKGGETCGTVGGGAIEYECIKLAQGLISYTPPFTKTYTLNHNTASDLGMVCGGEANILFQYLTPDSKKIEIFEHIVSLCESNSDAWLITDINSKDVEIGTYDTKNGICFISPKADIEKLCKSAPFLTDDEILTEPLSTSSYVYIFGGGHISQALCPLLSYTGFKVVVYEDNKKFADKSLFKTAEKIVCKSFSDINSNINVTKKDYVVILTRGHKSDNETIFQLLSKNPSYIGVIGSKKKVKFMHEFLLDSGFEKSEIEKIHSPIGIDIKAVTPEEIAVSITAELIKHRAENRL